MSINGWRFNVFWDNGDGAGGDGSSGPGSGNAGTGANASANAGNSSAGPGGPGTSSTTTGGAAPGTGGVTGPSSAGAAADAAANAAAATSVGGQSSSFGGQGAPSGPGSSATGTSVGQGAPGSGSSSGGGVAAGGVGGTTGVGGPSGSGASGSSGGGGGGATGGGAATGGGGGTAAGGSGTSISSLAQAINAALSVNKYGFGGLSPGVADLGVPPGLLTGVPTATSPVSVSSLGPPGFSASVVAAINKGLAALTGPGGVVGDPGLGAPAPSLSDLSQLGLITGFRGGPAPSMTMGFPAIEGVSPGLGGFGGNPASPGPSPDGGDQGTASVGPGGIGSDANVGVSPDAITALVHALAALSPVTALGGGPGNASESPTGTEGPSTVAIGPPSLAPGPTGLSVDVAQNQNPYGGVGDANTVGGQSSPANFGPTTNDASNVTSPGYGAPSGDPGVAGPNTAGQTAVGTPAPSVSESPTGVGTPAVAYADPGAVGSSAVGTPAAITANVAQTPAQVAAQNQMAAAGISQLLQLILGMAGVSPTTLAQLAQTTMERPQMAGGGRV